jgi:hypothetical protein
MSEHFNLRDAFYKYVDANYPPITISTNINNQASPITQPNPIGLSIRNNFWINMILYILNYAPFISGVGAVCYMMTSIISADLFSIFVNRNIIFLVNLLIGISGVVTILEWLSIDTLLSFSLLVAKIISGNIIN